MNMDLLKDLNEPQKEAVLHKDGPLLVVAGAGAGKTKVITHRIANLIKEGIKPGQILAVTFTNKAANEMKERIRKLIHDLGFKIYEPPTIGTFHSVCARILRENGRAVGLPSRFSILDSEDSLRIIKNSLKKLEINPKQFQPTKIRAIISKQKSNLISLEKYAIDAEDNFFPQTVAGVWEEYEKSLRKQKAADFDDLITKVVFLFQNRPEILEKYHEKWHYFLVDEYQDTNHSQYVLTKLLAGKSKNICVVGDEDQSIYGFRGANFGNILNFEKDWPNTKIILLEQNYRSTQNIIEAANSVIGKNKLRKPKKLFSMLDKGNSLAIFDALNEKQEAEFVAATSEELLRSGFKASDIAVLYRANFQSRALEESFIAYDIPYQVVGTKFFERKEIKDVIAYIKAALNPDDALSLERIINEPPRGVGKTGLMNYLAGKSLPALKTEQIKNFFGFLEEAKGMLLKEKLSRALAFILQKSGYKNYLNDGTDEGIMRLDNLKELLSLSLKYDDDIETGVEKFLEDSALMSDQDNLDSTQQKPTEGIKLMTVHAAKGLEFPSVFVAGLEEGLFPYGQFREYHEEEEERRLFYVALTRAKEKLFLSFAYSRNFFGNKQVNAPSRFLNEIPPNLFSNFDDLPETNYLT